MIADNQAERLTGFLTSQMAESIQSVTVPR